MQKMVNKIKSTKVWFNSINLVVDGSNRDKNWDEIGMKFREQNQNKIGVDSGADLGASYHVVFIAVFSVVNHLVLSWFFPWFPSGGNCVIIK